MVKTLEDSVAEEDQIGVHEGDEHSFHGLHRIKVGVPDGKHNRVLVDFMGLLSRIRVRSV